jgi:very-short-patch-repair endonuclease
MRGPSEQETARARTLRRRQTDAEAKLWRALRNRQLGGAKFVRQEPIAGYYADFVCRERGLIVELDGGQHADSAHDRRRDAALRQAGFRVVRIWNNEVFGNFDGVLEHILLALADPPADDP